MNDYEIGKRFDLEIINIMNDDATLNANAGERRGGRAQEANQQNGFIAPAAAAAARVHPTPCVTRPPRHTQAPTLAWIALWRASSCGQT